MSRDSEPTYVEVFNAVKLARRQVLDVLEASFGHQPNWPYVRARLLKIFGRDGLSRFWETEPLNGNRHDETSSRAKR